MTDLVVLVPGYLGFNQVGDFAYFADRTVPVLKTAFAASGLRPTVLPIPLGGLDSLQARQATLLKELAALAKSNAFDSIHLVGHSAGGVDAELLTRAFPICRGRKAHWRAIRKRLCSVTTIAAPIHGTALAQCAAARLIRTMGIEDVPEGLPQLMKLLPAAAKGGASSLIARLRFLVGGASTSGGAEFLFRFFFRNRLLADLVPHQMAKILKANPRDPRLPARVRSFVTAVPRRSVAPPARKREPSNSPVLFRLFQELTAEAPFGPVALEENLVALQRCPVKIPSDTATPIFDLQVNDGIVNSARQFLRPEELEAVVIGDHSDVIGHYYRIDEVTKEVLNPGLLASGANFRDDEFVELYVRIADLIMDALRGWNEKKAA